MHALLLLIAVVAIGGALYTAMRMRSAQRSQQRRAAWRAKREEEDRIWYEQMGEDPPPKR